MSNECNSILTNFERKFEVIISKPILFLLLIGLISIGLKIFFTRFDMPLESSDAFVYLLGAKQIAFENNLVNMPVNYGWQAFLALIFSGFNFSDNYGYMTIIRVTSIIISTISIPFVYLISKKFLDNRFALLAAVFFAFEPDLIENSIFGITEGIFILAGLIALYFSLNHKVSGWVLTGLFAGFALDIRFNGIIFFIFFIIMSLYFGKTGYCKLKYLGIFLLFFSIAASPFFIQNFVEEQNPFAFGPLLFNALDSKIAPNDAPNRLDDSLIEKFVFSTIEILKYIIRVTLPYIWLFSLFGLIVFWKERLPIQKILFLLIIITILIAIPNNILSHEYRSLFLILPILSIFAASGLQKILKKSSRKNIICTLIIAGIVLSSFLFLQERYQTDLELLKEKEKFGKFAATNLKGKVLGDLHTQIAHHLPDARLGTVIAEGKIHNSNLGLEGMVMPTNSMKDVVFYAKEKKVNFLIIDDMYDSRSPEFSEAYYNENNYPYLNKVFDSREEGYKKLKVKIFEIDYTKLE